MNLSNVGKGYQADKLIEGYSPHTFPSLFITERFPHRMSIAQMRCDQTYFKPCWCQ